MYASRYSEIIMWWLVGEGGLARTTSGRAGWGRRASVVSNACSAEVWPLFPTTRASNSVRACQFLGSLAPNDGDLLSAVTLPTAARHKYVRYKPNISSIHWALKSKISTLSELILDISFRTLHSWFSNKRLAEKHNKKKRNDGEAKRTVYGGRY